MTETIGTILIGIGVAFTLFGTIGLIRLPDMYNRLQAATKCVTLGTAILLIGGGIYSGIPSLLVKSILCAIFILVTSPVAAHAIARGGYISGVELWDGSVTDAYKEESKKAEQQS